jgi:hypothetical protein
VLSNLPDVRTAADWRAGCSLAALDAGLPGDVRATVFCGTNVRDTGALAIGRPRAFRGTLLPEMHQASSQTPALVEQDSQKKYQHSTRVAAIGGSATGSHPASWDPV